MIFLRKLFYSLCERLAYLDSICKPVMLSTPLYGGLFPTHLARLSKFQLRCKGIRSIALLQQNYFSADPSDLIAVEHHTGAILLFRGQWNGGFLLD